MAADNGGAWVSYFGGNFNGDNGTINYDQDVNGIMVGVDTKVDGNNAKWIVGAAAGFAKGDMSDRTGGGSGQPVCLHLLFRSFRKQHLC